jgi:MtaA/CmuA family methyltransferase
MNSLERYSGMLKGRAVDLVPRTPILMQFAAESIGSNYGAFASDYRVLVEANLHCAEVFGMDQLSTISDPYRETEGFGARIIFERDSVLRCERHPLEERRDFAALPRPDPLRSARMLDRVNAVRAYKSRISGRLSILGWIEGPAAEAADLRNVMNFLTDLMDDEGYSGALMDRCLEAAIRFAQAQAEAGADTIGIGDAIASQVSPSLYERLIQPREKLLVAAVQKMGAFVRLHICGNITHLLPGIADLGVDVLDVDHMVDMQLVRRAAGARVALAGNINPLTVRHRGPEEIASAMRRTYEAVGNPYLVNAGCEIPPGTPRENLLALCTMLPYRR